MASRWSTGGAAGVPFVDGSGGQVLANSSMAGYDPELGALSGSARWAIQALREDAAAGKTPHGYVGTQHANCRWKGVVWISREVARQLFAVGLIEIAEDRIVTVIEQGD